MILCFDDVVEYSYPYLDIGFIRFDFFNDKYESLSCNLNIIYSTAQSTHQHYKGSIANYVDMYMYSYSVLVYILNNTSSASQYSPQHAKSCTCRSKCTEFSFPLHLEFISKWFRCIRIFCNLLDDTR